MDSADSCLERDERVGPTREGPGIRLAAGPDGPGGLLTHLSAFQTTVIRVP
jgi:hypothetical protein